MIPTINYENFIIGDGDSSCAVKLSFSIAFATKLMNEWSFLLVKHYKTTTLLLSNHHTAILTHRSTPRMGKLPHVAKRSVFPHPQLVGTSGDRRVADLVYSPGAVCKTSQSMEKLAPCTQTWAEMREAWRDRVSFSQRQGQRESLKEDF